MQTLDEVTEDLMETARATEAKFTHLFSTAEDLKLIISRINGLCPGQEPDAPARGALPAIGKAA